jgi:DNA-directed RNA polymerase specialized sigma24 family protein
LTFLWNVKSSIFSVVFTIARNIIIDYYRSKSRTNLTSIETVVELTYSESDPSDTAVLDEIQQKLYCILFL